jgi:hypothetical protein
VVRDWPTVPGHRPERQRDPAVLRVIVSLSWLPGLRAQRLLREVYADVRGTRSCAPAAGPRSTSRRTR